MVWIRWNTFIRHSIHSILALVNARFLSLKFIPGLLLALALTYDLPAQKLLAGLAEAGGWGDGMIILKNGAELKGLVRYNNKSGILYYQNGDDSKTLVSKSVLGFQFIDPQTGKERVFLTIDYEDRQSSMKVPLFFEMLREYKEQLILSRVEPVQVKVKGGAQSKPGSFDLDGSTRTIVDQFEIIYFKSHDDLPKPYLQIRQKEVDRPLYDRSAQRTKIVNAELLKEWAGVHYKELNEYVKSKGMDLENKEDLLLALDYLDSLKQG